VEYNAIADRLRLIQSEGADAGLRDDIRALVSRRREVFIGAVLALRELVDSTAKTYGELAGSDDVKQALDEIGKRSKAKPALGPSRQFQENVRVLERIEKSVITDTVELRRTRGGVDEVDVTFNGRVTRPMIFDTGAALTMISAQLAAEIGLKPSSSDPEVRCSTADGTVVLARQKTIPSMRIGRFTVNNVLCAVMPPEKGNVEPLLGQSFTRNFSYKLTPGSGRLVITKVESPEPPQVRTGKTGARPRGPTRGRSTTKPKSAAAKTTSGDGPASGDPP
jgi:aspartyl protease family protein